MEDATLGLILDRLGSSGLSDEAQLVVLSACEGDDSLTQALGGDPPIRPTVSDLAELEEVEPAGAYLGPITVEGFRGIGKEVTLDLKPGPGLTLVVGRNGSGKSSFAEALEVLLTGSNFRWAARSSVWKEGWRNLHHPQQTKVSATFMLVDSGATTVERIWDPTVTITEGVATSHSIGAAKSTLEALGWSSPLIVYRPFLSYNELGSLLDEGPSILFDALSTILGMEELTAAVARLATERKTRKKRQRTWKEYLRNRIIPRLEGNEDERAIACLNHLEGRQTLANWMPDLEAVAAIVSGSGEVSADELTGLRRLSAMPPPMTLDEAANIVERLRTAARTEREVEATASSMARETQRLLELAIAFHSTHGDGDCPICGTHDALNEQWQEKATGALEGLRHQATQARRIEDEAKQVRDRARRAVDPITFLDDAERYGIDATAIRAAADDWSSVDPNAPLEQIATHIETHVAALLDAFEDFHSEAVSELDRREDAWRPVAVELASWVGEAIDAERAALASRVLKEAQDWLETATTTIRNERFAPIAGQARAIWSQLSPQSNVELVDISLQGSATTRHVELHVNVDGIDGAALGVMSQGELHSLALSLFFPRATLPVSPFRFVVVDDPVQSMDPARVDGLARVLESLAQTRQVVVFTHDDRLPSSVRDLSIDATILEVTRRTGSAVEVRETLDPVMRYLDDAFALINTTDMPEEAQRRVIPGFCRLAMESAFLLAFRRRSVRQGMGHADVDEAAQLADTTRKKAALAFHGDIQRTGEVMTALNRFGGWAGDVFKAAQTGAHSSSTADLEKMVRDTRSLTRKVLETYA